MKAKTERAVMATAVAMLFMATTVRGAPLNTSNAAE